MPVERVIAQTEKVAVCITRLAAYPTGFEFDLVTMAAHGVHDVDPMLFEHQYRRRGGSTTEIPPELLRFGVQLADGQKATNIASEFPAGRHEPASPVLMTGGGGGGGGDWQQSVRVWPLPPPGPLSIVCEWPSLDIPSRGWRSMPSCCWMRQREPA